MIDKLLDIILLIIPIIVIGLIVLDLLFSGIKKRTNKIAIFIQIILIAIVIILSFILPIKIEDIGKDLISMKKVLISIGSICVIIFLYLQSIIKRYFDLKELTIKLFDGDESIVTKLNNKIIDLGDKATILDSALLKVDKHPIITSNDDFKPVIESLFKLGKTKDVALKFSFDCLQQISKTGFIQIDIPFEAYSKMLEELTDLSTKRIIGTFTVRPDKIYQQLNSRKKCFDEIEYLKKINEKEGIVNRIIVFEIEEINGILNHAIELEPKLKDSMYTLNETPEIIWFNNNLKANKTFWTITPKFLKEIGGLSKSNLLKIIDPCGNKHSMTDFAIFDEEVLLIWRENAVTYIDKDKFTGTLIMKWGDEVLRLNNLLKGYGTHKAFTHLKFDDLLNEISLEGESLAKDSIINTNDFKTFKSLHKKYTYLREQGYKWGDGNYKNLDQII